MKCKNCGYVNTPEATHCKRCNTMIRRAGIADDSGSKKAMVQIFLLIAGTVGVVVMLWILMHNLLHVL
jgi:hypothetical protein